MIRARTSASCPAWNASCPKRWRSASREEDVFRNVQEGGGPPPTEGELELEREMLAPG